MTRAPEAPAIQTTCPAPSRWSGCRAGGRTHGSRATGLRRLAHRPPVTQRGMGRLRQVWRCYATVWVDAGLRRLVAGMAANVTADQALLVAVAIYAHQRGGAGLMGTVALVQMSVAAAVAPVFGRVAARRSCRLVLAMTASGGAALMAGCALASAAGAPLWVVVALATAARTATGAARPARLAVAPWLARTPAQLEASNVASGTAEGVAYFAGPALAGASMAAWSPAAAMVVAAISALGSAWAAAGLPRVGGGLTAGPGTDSDPARFRALLGRVSTLALLFATQTFVRGLLNVLIVAAAVDLLGAGESGAGVLQAFLGVGGVVGSLVVAGSPAGRRAGAFAGALVAWGAPVALIGLVPHPGVAILALCVIGVANVGVDVHGFTLLQRALPGEVSAAAFASLESLLLAGVGVGSMIGGVLVGLVGTRTALGVAGMVLPLAVLVSLRSLLAVGRRLAAAEEQAAVMRQVPAIGVLPVAAVDLLTREGSTFVGAAGDVLLHQGSEGDDVLVVLEGSAVVVRDGVEVARVGSGHLVGEVAALYGMPRTASVVSEGDLVAIRVHHQDLASVLADSPDADALLRDAASRHTRGISSIPGITR